MTDGETEEVEFIWASDQAMHPGQQIALATGAQGRIDAERRMYICPLAD